MKTETTVMRRVPIGAMFGMLAVFAIFLRPALARANEVSRDKKAPASAAACGTDADRLCGPDDYDCKPAPCVSPVACRCADTYRPKPCLVLPCTTKCCCTDDYCPKSRPTLCQPKASAWYKCVPTVSCPWLPRTTRGPTTKTESEACK